MADLRVTLRTRWGDLRGILRDVEDVDRTVSELGAAAMQLDDERAVAVVSLAVPDDRMDWEETTYNRELWPGEES